MAIGSDHYRQEMMWFAEGLKYNMVPDLDIFRREKMDAFKLILRNIKLSQISGCFRKQIFDVKSIVDPRNVIFGIDEDVLHEDIQKRKEMKEAQKKMDQE
jgi:hypothetical protein